MAPLHIAIAWRLRRPDRVTPLLARIARRAAAAEGFRTGQLSIAVVGARAMATLHERYMRDPRPTDVLTFDLGTDRRAHHLDGEIVVCAAVAARVAAERLRSTARTRSIAAPALAQATRAELALYIVHGLLHLAGYDDHMPADFARMHAREDALLRAAGLGAVFAPEFTAKTQRAAKNAKNKV